MCERLCLVMGDISVIVPVYNGEKYIEGCIEALLKEREYLKEIIIVNDGSRDRTTDLLKKYDSISAVKVISQDNKGVSAARNNGLKESTGQWIVFCDVDDQINEGFFADITGEIARKPDADIICYARAKVGKNDDQRNEEFFDKKVAFQMVLEHSEYQYASDYLLMMVWSKVFKKDFLEQRDIMFNEKISFGEDMLYMLECVLKSKRIDLIHRGYYVYLPNDEGACKRGGSINDFSGFMELCEKIEMLKAENRVFFEDKEVFVTLKQHMYYYGNNVCGRVARGTRGMVLAERKRAVRKICNRLKEYGKAPNKKESLIFALKEKFAGIYVLWASK